VPSMIRIGVPAIAITGRIDRLLLKMFFI
jgi:hypothetical protein